MAAKKPKKKVIQQEQKSYIDDPELGDENDPEYKKEMFETFKHMGWKPEDLTTDKKCAAEYAKWLKKK